MQPEQKQRKRPQLVLWLRQLKASAYASERDPVSLDELKGLPPSEVAAVKARTKWIYYRRSTLKRLLLEAEYESRMRAVQDRCRPRAVELREPTTRMPFTKQQIGRIRSFQMPAGEEQALQTRFQQQLERRRVHQDQFEMLTAGILFQNLEKVRQALQHPVVQESMDLDTWQRLVFTEIDVLRLCYDPGSAPWYKRVDSGPDADIARLLIRAFPRNGGGQEDPDAPQRILRNCVRQAFTDSPLPLVALMCGVAPPPDVPNKGETKEDAREADANPEKDSDNEGSKHRDTEHSGPPEAKVRAPGKHETPHGLAASALLGGLIALLQSKGIVRFCSIGFVDEARGVEFTDPRWSTMGNDSDDSDSDSDYSNEHGDEHGDSNA